MKTFVYEQFQTAAAFVKAIENLINCDGFISDELHRLRTVNKGNNVSLMVYGEVVSRGCLASLMGVRISYEGTTYKFDHVRAGFQDAEDLNMVVQFLVFYPED